MASNKPIIKVTFAGATSVVLRDSNIRPQTAAVDSDGTLWTIDKVTGGTYYGLYYITGAGSGSDVRTQYALFTDMTIAEGNAVYVNNMKIVDDNLYFVYSETAYNANHQIVKFTDITGTADRSVIDTGLAIATYEIHDILVISDTEIYITLSTGAIGTARYVYKFYYAGGTWLTSTVVDSHEYVPVYHYEKYGDIRPLRVDSYGNYSLGGVIDGAEDYISIYDSEWNLTENIALSGVTYAVGFSSFLGSAVAELTYTVCGYTSNNVYKVYSNGYWTNAVDATLEGFWNSEAYTDSTMDIDGVLGRIVSNYEDLTVANHKRLCRAYMDTMSEYATCGVFAIEADYTTNLSIHENSESSEPSGAVFRAPFASGGQQTWNTNSSFSSGTVENWQTHRLDVGLSGRKFRYSIKFGDIPGANQGSFYLKPPSFDGQIKGKY